MWFSFRVDQGAYWQFHWPWVQHTHVRPEEVASVCSQDFDNFVKCGLLSCQSTVGLSTGFDDGRGLSSTWSIWNCMSSINPGQSTDQSDTNDSSLTSDFFHHVLADIRNQLTSWSRIRRRHKQSRSERNVLTHLKLTKPWTLSPNP